MKTGYLFTVFISKEDSHHGLPLAETPMQAGTCESFIKKKIREREKASAVSDRKLSAWGRWN